ncbi:excinuclease ABC subunit A [Shewanella sp. WXL01]|uniref:Excinuclease ABC subunit A n=1 Tax=Shewanella maritima TaxID=2520507 RepID=A0A411PJ36_9GAMM|nr:MULTISPECIES: excinuclease ABC subunit A [Shewanella]NKF51287.1 excinuclease ABC subunit A [Shewanella sp. WXL01]QBF83596.1 excinuclease ABC subunit A [Shewanella maritima]
MKKLLMLLLLGSISTTATAREDIQDFSINEAMAINKISSAIGEGVEFYFAGQQHGAIVKSLGEFKTSKKTNAFGKSDLKACQWAFASAMKSLKQRAQKEGGNAVVNIRSNYDNHQTSSAETFKCGAGNVIAGVALIGDVVTLEK